MLGINWDLLPPPWSNVGTLQCRISTTDKTFNCAMKWSFQHFCFSSTCKHFGSVRVQSAVSGGASAGKTKHWNKSAKRRNHNKTKPWRLDAARISWSNRWENGLRTFAGRELLDRVRTKQVHWSLKLCCFLFCFFYILFYKFINLPQTWTCHNNAFSLTS